LGLISYCGFDRAVADPEAGVEFVPIEEKAKPAPVPAGKAAEKAQPKPPQDPAPQKDAAADEGVEEDYQDYVDKPAEDAPKPADKGGKAAAADTADKAAADKPADKKAATDPPAEEAKGVQVLPGLPLHQSLGFCLDVGAICTPGYQ
jgi:cobalamin biosynthesis protein CobT